MQRYKTGFPKQIIFRLCNSCTSIFCGEIVMKLISARNFLLKMPNWIRVSLFHELNRISPSPFSAFYSVDQKYLLCASPERYLKKTGDRILSQPIKGTSARNPENAILDEELKDLTGPQ